MTEKPTLRRRLLGAELRRLREAAGFALDDAARILECDRSKISRIETGHRGMRPKELRELVAEYGVDDERRSALADLARQTRKPGWWQEYASGLPEPYRDLIGLEDAAATMDVFQTHRIPDLLQTEPYARSIAGASPVKDAPRTWELLTATRTLRQQVLAREPNPMRLRAIVAEGAIRHMVGGTEVMRGQLHHLIDIQTAQAGVTVQVLPFETGAPACVGGPFAVLFFPPPVDIGVVYLDTLTGGLYLETPEDVEQYRTAFEQLTTAALPTDASNKLIEKTVTDL